jgi:hypothetical protein
MKKLIILLALFGLTITPLHAGENMVMKPYEGSKEFNQMKKLLGSWEGTSKMHSDKDQRITVDYALMSNGSVIVETLFKGTPDEMVTTYYDRKGKLSLTHYCAVGNRPLMELISGNDNELKFDFSAENDIDPKTEMHMHALTITFVDENSIRQDWMSYTNGQPAETASFNFTKVKKNGKS